jgi:SAM-dependent methyltransferase
MQIQRHRPCPLCGSTTLEALTELTLPQPSGSPLPSAYRLVGCEVCDLAFADTPVPQTGYDHYYETQAKYGGATGTGAGQNSTDLNRLRQLAERLRPWLPHRHAKVLDIGCGGGGLLQVLTNAGYTRCEGLDPDAAAVSAARAKGLKVTQGLLSHVPTLFAAQRFDLLVMSHVVEHLRDLDWIDKLARLLMPHGAMYIEVPDADRYRIGSRPANYYFDSEHINHFGRQALEKLIKKAQLNLSTFIECELPLPDGSAYPALAAVGTDQPQTPTTQCPATLTQVRRYIHDGAAKATAAPTIRPPLPSDVPLLIWGAGSLTQRLIGQGGIPMTQAVAFLDGNPNKQGLSLVGKPICAPVEGLQRYPTAHVLVCIAIDPHQVEREIQLLDACPARTLHFFDTFT